MSLVTVIALATAVRGVGFIGVVAGAQSTAAALVPYLVLAAAIVLGGLGISRGLIIEPPAFVSNWVNAVVEGFARRTGAVAGAQAQ
jgi:hypothetical protein